MIEFKIPFPTSQLCCVLIGTVHIFLNISQQIRLIRRVLNIQVSCIMALYVGCTIQSSECASEGFWQSFPPLYQKPTETPSLKQVEHSTKSFILHETYISTRSESAKSTVKFLKSLRTIPFRKQQSCDVPLILRSRRIDIQVRGLEVSSMKKRIFSDLNSLKVFHR